MSEIDNVKSAASPSNKAIAELRKENTNTSGTNTTTNIDIFLIITMKPVSVTVITGVAR
ncbi:MAG: hypothetical protein ACREBA_11735 [Nitrosotalea sp.]